MSTNTPYASDAQPNTESRPNTETQSITETHITTAVAARGRADPWTVPGETSSFTVDRAPRQFEPTCRKRLRNAMDEENAYVSR